MSKKEKVEKVEKNNDDIEVIIGDESIIQISEVGDCMNDLRPKDSVKNRKNFIIPIAKKNKKNEKKENDKKENDKKDN